MNYKIKNSKIQGKGAFANKAYKKGDQISDESDYANEANQSLLSFFHNHDEKNANMNYVIGDGVVNLIASKDIKVGDELVSNYYDMQYPGSPYEDPSEFEKKKKTLGKRKRKLKEGGMSGTGDKYTMDVLYSNPPKYQIIEKETGKSLGIYSDRVTAQAALEKLNGGPSIDIDIDPGFNPKDSERPPGIQRIQIDPGFSPNFPKTIKRNKDITLFKDGGLAKFLIGGSGGPKSREQIYEESLSDTGVESSKLSDFNTAGTDSIYYLDNPDYFKNNPINTGNPEYDAQVKKAIFENNMGWNPHNQSIYFKQWEAPESMETLSSKPIESIDQDIVERETPKELTLEDVKTDPRFEVLFKETEEEVEKDIKQAERKIKQDGIQKRNKTPRVIIGKGRRRTGLKDRFGLQEGGMVNELSKFVDGGPTKDELAYFVDDAGKPFKYKGKTWSDIAKLPKEEQRGYLDAFSTYESDRDNRQYESNIKSKRDPFYKVDLYGGGKTVWGDKSKGSGKYEYEEMASKLERAYKEKFPDKKVPKLETTSDFNKLAKAIDLPTYFVNEPNGGFSMASNADVANRIYNKGLTATQLSKMGFGSRAEIQDHFAPVFKVHKANYDKRNLSSIEKDILAGVSVKDAIQKIADKNQGTVEGLTKLYKTSSIDKQNEIIKGFEGFYSGSNKEGFFGSQYDEMNKNYKAEELGKMEDIFEEMRTGKFNPNATMEDAINHYSASSAFDESKDPLKKFTEEVKNKDLSNEEKIKLYNNLFPEFQKDQEKKARDAFFTEQHGYYKSDEEMDQHLASQDDITNPYRKASTFTKFLHPIDALGHLAKYGNTDRMMETDPSAGIWKDNLVMQALDGASYLAPGLGQVRAGQLLGDAGKGFVDYGSQWAKDEEAPDISYLAAPALQATFGALSARTGLKNLFSTKNLASNIPGTVKPSYFSSPYRNIFKPNSQTFLARPNMVGTKTINLPGNRQIAYGNPFNTRGSNLVTKAQSKQLEQGQKLIDDAFTAEGKAWDIIDFNKKGNLIGTGLTTPLSFTGTWDAMLGTGSQPKYRAVTTSVEKTGGVIKLPKNKKLPKHNFRGVVKNLAKYYPDMETVGSGLLTPEYVKRIKDIAKLKSFLTYAGNINRNLGDNRKILNYNIGKAIADSDINYGDIVDSRKELFNYDMDNRGVVNRILKEEGVESLLRRVLGATGQKDFSQLKPFGDIEMGRYGSKNRYDHEQLMSKVYQNPDYNDSPLPFTQFQSGDYFTPDKDFTQQYFDQTPFDYDIGSTFGDSKKVLGTIKDALPVFYAKNFRNQRETATYGIESINYALHNARPRTFLTDAGSKTPDSYLMGANQLIKSMNTYPEILGNTQFIGYSTLNREAFSDSFFKGKEKAIRQGELRGPYTGSPRAVADKNQEFFNRLRGEFTSDALNKIYSKYNFEGLPAITLPQGLESTSAISSRNRGLGTGFGPKLGETYFPNYAVQKLRPMSLEEALKVKFEEGGYSLGDEVDEVTMKELKKLGYTLEEA